MDQEVNWVLRKKFEYKNYEALNTDEKREYDEIVAFYEKRKKQTPINFLFKLISLVNKPKKLI